MVSDGSGGSGAVLRRPCDRDFYVASMVVTGVLCVLMVAFQSTVRPWSWWLLGTSAALTAAGRITAWWNSRAGPGEVV